MAGLRLDSRTLFTALVAAFAAERLVELELSRRNRLRLLARGGVELGAAHYRWMVLLHAAFLPACVLEVWLLRRPFVPSLAATAAGLLAAAQVVRVWTIRTLGERWCTRVIVLPGAALVTTGPYRWVRHPNYLVVAVEIAALPLLHTAWLTAVVFSVADALLLAVRIRIEEQALAGSRGPAPGVEAEVR